MTSRHFTRRGALVGLALTLGTLVVPATATASVPATTSQVSVQTLTPAALPAAHGVGAAGDKCPGGQSLADSSCLPLNRWSDATTMFHSRLGSKIWDDTSQKIQRDGAQAQITMLGTFGWQFAADISQWAVNFSFMEVAGQTIDRTFADVAHSVIGIGRGGGDASIVQILILGAVLATIFRAATRRGEGHGKRLVGSALAVALLVVMAQGAMKSTGTTPVAHDDPTQITTVEKYNPGTLSPGWFILRLNKAVSLLTDAPVRALVAPKYTAAPTSTDTVTCADYVNALNNRALGAGGQGNSVPLIISQMWVNSGLQAWARSQYGANNDYGQYAYCHQLEQQSQISNNRQRGVFLEAAPQSAPNAKANPFDQTNNVDIDNALVGWGACHLRKGQDGNKAESWIVDENWRQAHREGADGAKGGPITTTMCANWWGEGFDANASALEYENGGQIAEATKGNDNKSVRDYLLTLQGHYIGSGMIASISYLFSGAGVLLSFGAVSGANILGKVAQGFLILGFLWALLRMAWGGRAANQGLAKSTKTLLGVAVFVALAALILAALALFTDIVATVGYAMFGRGSLMGVMWTGAAPLIAMLCLAKAFTAAGAPNPFKLSSALAFGAAAGSVGSAVAQRMQGLGTSARQLANGTGSGSGRSAGAGAGRGEGGRGPSSPSTSGGGRGANTSSRDIAKGQRGAAAAALEESGKLSRQDRHEALVERSNMTAEELMDAQSPAAHRAQTAAILAAAKKQRRERNDALAERYGFKGRNGDNRLTPAGWAQRTAALTKGRAAMKVREEMALVRTDPAAALRLGLRRGKYLAGAAAVVGTGGAALPFMAGYGAYKHLRTHGLRGGATAIRDRAAGVTNRDLTRDDYTAAVVKAFEADINGRMEKLHYEETDRYQREHGIAPEDMTEATREEVQKAVEARLPDIRRRASARWIR